MTAPLRRSWPSEPEPGASVRERRDLERAQARTTVGLFDGRAYVHAEPVGLLADLACVLDEGACSVIAHDHGGAYGA